ncbi:conserved Plasmodium protein, unknown function [Plasmodium gaboni]|uniref:Cleavage/polyadenylation specificity factor A subunit C-terminal domain-containing protein n=1 Tax=Plasmodium gaboni TaxID=647221 RepID=A0ABY1UQZ6_9APIC|nr:conserved Plasmodium protein, unknown function [Plasmodium gaboni]
MKYFHQYCTENLLECSLVKFNKTRLNCIEKNVAYEEKYLNKKKHFESLLDLKFCTIKSRNIFIKTKGCDDNFRDKGKYDDPLSYLSNDNLIDNNNNKIYNNININEDILNNNGLLKNDVEYSVYFILRQWSEKHMEDDYFEYSKKNDNKKISVFKSYVIIGKHTHRNSICLYEEIIVEILNYNVDVDGVFVQIHVNKNQKKIFLLSTKECVLIYYKDFEREKKKCEMEKLKRKDMFINEKINIKNKKKKFKINPIKGYLILHNKNFYVSPKRKIIKAEWFNKSNNIIALLTYEKYCLYESYSFNFRSVFRLINIKNIPFEEVKIILPDMDILQSKISGNFDSLKEKMDIYNKREDDINKSKNKEEHNNTLTPIDKSDNCKDVKKVRLDDSKNYVSNDNTKDSEYVDNFDYSANETPNSLSKTDEAWGEKKKKKKMTDDIISENNKTKQKDEYKNNLYNYNFCKINKMTDMVESYEYKLDLKEEKKKKKKNYYYDSKNNSSEYAETSNYSSSYDILKERKKKKQIEINGNMNEGFDSIINYYNDDITNNNTKENDVLSDDLQNNEKRYLLKKMKYKNLVVDFSFGITNEQILWIETCLFLLYENGIILVYTPVLSKRCYISYYLLNEINEIKNKRDMIIKEDPNYEERNNKKNKISGDNNINIFNNQYVEDFLEHFDYFKYCSVEKYKSFYVYMNFFDTKKIKNNKKNNKMKESIILDNEINSPQNTSKNNSFQYAPYIINCLKNSLYSSINLIYYNNLIIVCVCDKYGYISFFLLNYFLTPFLISLNKYKKEENKLFSLSFAKTKKKKEPFYFNIFNINQNVTLQKMTLPNMINLINKEKYDEYYDKLKNKLTLKNILPKAPKQNGIVKRMYERLMIKKNKINNSLSSNGGNHILPNGGNHILPNGGNHILPNGGNGMSSYEDNYILPNEDNYIVPNEDNYILSDQTKKKTTNYIKSIPDNSEVEKYNSASENNVQNNKLEKSKQFKVKFEDDNKREYFNNEIEENIKGYKNKYVEYYRLDENESNEEYSKYDRNKKIHEKKNYKNKHKKQTQIIKRRETMNNIKNIKRQENQNEVINQVEVINQIEVINQNEEDIYLSCYEDINDMYNINDYIYNDINMEYRLLNILFFDSFYTGMNNIKSIVLSNNSLLCFNNNKVIVLNLIWLKFLNVIFYLLYVKNYLCAKLVHEICKTGLYMKTSIFKSIINFYEFDYYNYLLLDFTKKLCYHNFSKLFKVDQKVLLHFHKQVKKAQNYKNYDNQNKYTSINYHNNNNNNNNNYSIINKQKNEHFDLFQSEVLYNVQYILFPIIVENEHNILSNNKNEVYFIFSHYINTECQRKYELFMKDYINFFTCSINKNLYLVYDCFKLNIIKNNEQIKKKHIKTNIHFIQKKKKIHKPFCLLSQNINPRNFIINTTIVNDDTLDISLYKLLFSFFMNLGAIDSNIELIKKNLIYFTGTCNISDILIFKYFYKLHHINYKSLKNKQNNTKFHNEYITNYEHSFYSESNQSNTHNDNNDPYEKNINHKYINKQNSKDNSHIHNNSSQNLYYQHKILNKVNHNKNIINEYENIYNKSNTIYTLSSIEFIKFIFLLLDKNYSTNNNIFFKKTYNNKVDNNLLLNYNLPKKDDQLNPEIIMNDIKTFIINSDIKKHENSDCIILIKKLIKIKNNYIDVKDYYIKKYNININKSYKQINEIQYLENILKTYYFFHSLNTYYEKKFKKIKNKIIHLIALKIINFIKTHTSIQTVSKNLVDKNSSLLKDMQLCYDNQDLIRKKFYLIKKKIIMHNLLISQQVRSTCIPAK